MPPNCHRLAATSVRLVAASCKDSHQAAVLAGRSEPLILPNRPRTRPQAQATARTAAEAGDWGAGAHCTQLPHTCLLWPQLASKELPRPHLPPSPPLASLAHAQQLLGLGLGVLDQSGGVVERRVATAVGVVDDLLGRLVMR